MLAAAIKMFVVYNRSHRDFGLQKISSPVQPPGCSKSDIRAAFALDLVPSSSPALGTKLRMVVTRSPSRSASSSKRGLHDQPGEFISGT